MEKDLLLECQRKDRNAQRKVYEKMAGKNIPSVRGT